MGGVIYLSQLNAQATVKITGPKDIEVGKSNEYTAELNGAPNAEITSVSWDAFSSGISGIAQVTGSIDGGTTAPLTKNLLNPTNFVFGDLFAPTESAKILVTIYYNLNGSSDSRMGELEVNLEGINKNFYISGPNETLKCCNDPLVYRAEGYKGKSSTGYTFSWTYPNNWTVNGSATSESITLLPDGNTTGTVSCTIRRPNAVSAYFVTKSNPVSLKNQFISEGPSFKQSKICYGEILTYNLDPMCNVSSYNWTFPSGWLIQSGQGTNTVVVVVGNNAVDGSVFVTANFPNGCTQVNTSFVLDVLTEAPGSVKDDKAAGSYENYHCNNWKYCFPGSSYGNLIFAEDLPSVQQWTFRTQHPFRVNGQLQVSTNEPFATVSCVSNPAPNTGVLQIQGVNCQGTSPWYSVNFVKEIDYWCTESAYPPYCECCAPPCASCPPYMVNEVNPDLLNQSISNISPQSVSDNEYENSGNLTIYPNPTSNTIIIESAHLGSDILIFNTLGDQVFSIKKLAVNILTIDVSTFDNGIYHVVELSSAGYRFRHFIKN